MQYMVIFNKKSIIEPIIQKIYDAKSFDEAKQIFISTIEGSKINQESKNIMLRNVKEIESKYNSDHSRLQGLQIYATNSMFEKKGMGGSRY